MLTALLFVAACVLPPLSLGDEPPQPAAAKPAATFANPVMERYPDPHAVLVDGTYYAARSLRGEKLELRRTKDLTDLANAEAKVVWTPPPNTDHSKHLWAPEIHKRGGAWYIYYAADDGNSDHHHMYVLENTSPDPFQGEFKMKARFKTDAQDCWAIDGTVFEHKGVMYFAWSGWPGPLKGEETACIYLAKMSNPWTLSSERVEISRPEHAWERNWKNPPEWNKTPGRPVFVNEGPAFIARGDKVFIAYSASGCWTPTYCLGLLTANADADLLSPASWTKSPEPVFQQEPSLSLYGTGHHSFITSPDGKEDWFFYHASVKPNECGGSTRSARLQKLTWKHDGTPDFGKPAATGAPIPKPSGTP